MLQCKDCEFCEMGPEGQVQLKCNPFATIKEPECLMKWQLLRLDMMTRAYVATIAEYKRIAPLQEKLYRHMSREVDEADEADKWKRAADEDEPDDEDEDEDADADRV
ncbi:MAG: hypothetical protein FJ288_06415 [Planctomycetes bacterium]|nr:hypothetical protein [Planctomycetota bacterium]